MEAIILSLLLWLSHERTATPRLERLAAVLYDATTDIEEPRERERVVAWLATTSLYENGLARQGVPFGVMEARICRATREPVDCARDARVIWATAGRHCGQAPLGRFVYYGNGQCSGSAWLQAHAARRTRTLGRVQRRLRALLENAQRTHAEMADRSHGIDRDVVGEPAGE